MKYQLTAKPGNKTATFSWPCPVSFFQVHGPNNVEWPGHPIVRNAFSLVGQVITWHSSDGRADNNCTNEFYQPRTRRVYTPGFGQVLMPCYLQVRRTSASQISWQPLLLYLRNAGMGGPIDMEWKGYKSIGCYTYFVTLSCDLDLGFSGSNFKNDVSQEWEGRLTWNQRDVSR